MGSLPRSISIAFKEIRKTLLAYCCKNEEIGELGIQLSDYRVVGGLLSKKSTDKSLHLLLKAKDSQIRTFTSWFMIIPTLQFPFFNLISVKRITIST